MAKLVDELTQAILLAFDQTPGPDTEMKQRAIAYIEKVKNSNDGWRTCLQKLHQSASSNAEEVKFYCIQVVQHVVTTRYGTLSEEDRAALRSSLMVFTRDIIAKVPQSNLIKTKLAVVLVRMMKHDYPERWNFFRDFLPMLDLGLDVIVLFLRVLKCIDEEIVDGDDRTRDELARSAHIKDSMRNTVNPKIVDALYQILVKTHTAHPAIAKDCLDILGEFICWIDINLVANDRFLALFYNFLSVPGLQVEACEALHEIVVKKMDPEKKIPLIGQIKIFEVLGGDRDFRKLPLNIAVQLASLVDTLGTLCLEAIAAASPHHSKKGSKGRFRSPSGDDGDFSPAIKSAPSPALQPKPNPKSKKAKKKGMKDGNPDEKNVSFSLPPPALPTDKPASDMLDLKRTTSDGEPSRPSPETVEKAKAMLEKALNLAYRFMEHPHPNVPQQLLGMFQQFISYLKLSPSRSTEEVEHFKRIFFLVSKNVTYPDWYNFDRPDDKEFKVDEFRTELLKLTMNQMRCLPALSLEIVRDALTKTTHPSALAQLPFSHVEVALKLMYSLGEAAGGVASLVGDEAFRTMFANLLRSKVSEHPHPQVIIIYFESTVRYSKIFEHMPDLLGTVLYSLLDSRGMQSKHSTVRKKACYCMVRLVRSLPEAVRIRIRPNLDDILKPILSVVGSVLSLSSAQSQQLISFEDCLNLCELAGLLIVPKVTGDKFKDYFSFVLGGMQQHLDRGIAQKNQWAPADAILIGKRLSMIVESIAYFTKPFHTDIANQVSELLMKCQQSVMQVFILLPRHDAVRKNTITFTHRMIECLQDKVLSTMPETLDTMLQHSDASNIVALMALVNQLIQTFRAKLHSVMDNLLMPFVTKLIESIKSYAYVDKEKGAKAAYSTEKQERIELQKSYFIMVKNIMVCEMSGVILQSPKNKPLLRPILESVMQGCVDPPDIAINKICLAFIKQFVEILAAGKIEPWIQSFVFQDVTKRLFQCALSPHISFDDAGSMALIKEIIGVLKLICQKFQQPYLNNLHEILLSLGVPSEQAKVFCLGCLQGTNVDQLRKQFVELLTPKKALFEKSASKPA